MKERGTFEVMETAGEEYAARLRRKQLAVWKRWLRRIDPYGRFLRSLDPGRTLEVGCGIGRNLAFLAPDAVGVDHNAASVRACRDRGFEAWMPDEVPEATANFDTLLVAHVLEHMRHDEAVALLVRYTRRLHPQGRVLIITPQERGFASDPTHVQFVDHRAATRICEAAGLTVVSQRSFPLPRRFGRLWIYNEFVTIAATSRS